MVSLIKDKNDILLTVDKEKLIFEKKKQPKLSGSIQVVNGEPLLGYAEHERPVISLRENSHALRLTSELVTSFACVSPSGETEPVRATHAVLITTSKQKQPMSNLGSTQVAFGEAVWGINPIINRYSGDLWIVLRTVILGRIYSVSQVTGCKTEIVLSN